MRKVRICPICGRTYEGAPAMSRRDNKTEICPACGLREALEDFDGYLAGLKGERRCDEKDTLRSSRS